ncbi:hypothetical protein SO802_021449 [Lithocarpus litseifolius]|uniref:Uncharacterized protein n=1 Tax=Lithocarpus litseifolius TaxID=425828 RepID=A0AAW2CGC6_9ROSI
MARPNVITNPLPPHSEGNINVISSMEERIPNFSSPLFPWKAMLWALAQESHIVLENITKQPVDSGAPALKKGQTMLVVKGFAPLVLALPTIAKSSLGFIQKGAPAVPASRGFDPLVLPRSTLRISRVPGPKASNAALPGPNIISLKMFSLAPNLQTQEGVIIRKEEVCSNFSSGLSGLTRSGRCYTPGELEKRRKEIGKGTAELVRNKVTTKEAEELLQTIQKVNHSVIQPLEKSPAQISISALLLSSRDANEMAGLLTIEPCFMVTPAE